MSNANLPVACALSTPELREREQTVLAKIRTQVQEIRDLTAVQNRREPASGQELTR